VYDTALKAIGSFFSTGLEWRPRPTEGGLHVLTHLDKAKLEVVIVTGDQFFQLYDITDRTKYFVDDVVGLWLGPLPMTPIVRRGSL